MLVTETELSCNNDEVPLCNETKATTPPTAVYNNNIDDDEGYKTDCSNIR